MGFPYFHKFYLQESHQVLIPKILSDSGRGREENLCACAQNLLHRFNAQEKTQKTQGITLAEERACPPLQPPLNFLAHLIEGKTKALGARALRNRDEARHGARCGGGKKLGHETNTSEGHNLKRHVHRKRFNQKILELPFPDTLPS